jgi:hypothetical protein
MPSVVMLSVIMLKVTYKPYMLSVVMLSVVAPSTHLYTNYEVFILLYMVSNKLCHIKLELFLVCLSKPEDASLPRNFVIFQYITDS